MMEIEKLPIEIASNIFSRLPFDSVLQCKSISKSWCNLLQHLIYTRGDRYFAHKHRSRLLENHDHLNSSSLPDSVLLMLDQFAHKLHYMEYIDDQNGFHCKAIKKFNYPLKMDSKFWTMATSSNGLICSAHQTDDNDEDDSYLLYVCNPFLGQYVTLPNKFEYYSTEISMAFGFGHVFPTDEYKVVRIVYPPGVGDEGNVEVYTLGGEKSSSNGKWRSIGNIECRLQCDSPGVLVNESCHWLTQKDVKQQAILAFDLLEEVFHVIPLPSRLQSANSDFKIIEFDGSLCGIEYIEEERKTLLWNLKEDYYMENKKVSQEKDYWMNFHVLQPTRSTHFEHLVYWKKVDQSIVWLSNPSSVVAVEHDDVLGRPINLRESRHVILFHGIPHIKTFVSLTALGENDVKTIKDNGNNNNNRRRKRGNNRQQKRGNKQRRKQKQRRLYIAYSSDDE